MSTYTDGSKILMKTYFFVAMVLRMAKSWLKTPSGVVREDRFGKGIVIP